mmetsp:Transcript_79756/g.185189  ORF Transcript_79756/g.185189 Transcript_79756/m.185189 type:complete len:456 (-) Transcript_79756:110-1477(-)
MLRFLSLCFFATCAWARGPLPVPVFKINLDLAPEDRFTEVIKHFFPLLRDFIHILDGSFLVDEVAKKISDRRGPERDEELMGEIRGSARDSGIPLHVMHAVQLIYELNTLMVPIDNITLGTAPGPLFGCTGIIARSEADGTVYHARNQDFSFAKWLQNMTYNGVFFQGGKELFTAQMIAGYAAVPTGFRPGPNGYTFEMNTRFADHPGGNEEMIKNIFDPKRTPSGWLKRKLLQSVDNYEDAVATLSTTPLMATEYNFISGVQKGVILARNPDGLAYKLTLGENRYIILTNFDYVYHDIREYLDPTAVAGIGHVRRLGAEKILNASKVITPELLYTVLNDDSVMATDTIFQAIMNAEKGLYNTSLPFCKSCGGCVDPNQCRKDGETCCTAREHFSLDCDVLGGYRCGCLPDGACRFPRFNMTEGDEDCCSFESHFTLDCASTRRCGRKPTVLEYV